MVPSRYVLLLVAASVSVTSVAIAQASRVPFGTVTVPGSASAATQLSGGPTAGTNLVVNGDFEDYSGGLCDTDLTNAAFTAMMADATGFGAADEIDVYSDQACPGPPAPSGETLVRIRGQADGDFDAFSLRLAPPVVAGSSYDLRFLVMADALSPSLGRVQIGLSSDAVNAGVPIYVGTVPGQYQWLLFCTTFNAPINADFVTVSEVATDAASFVDTLRLTAGGLGEKCCFSNNNSTGYPADLVASGSASTSAGDLTLTSAPVPNQHGIFIHGVNQVQVPYSCGYLCVSGAIVRGASVVASGWSATYTYDNSSPRHDLSSFVGSTRVFQHWFRDPMAGGCLLNLSTALAITIEP